jgi:hypothetical protein
MQAILLHKPTFTTLTVNTDKADADSLIKLSSPNPQLLNIFTFELWGSYGYYGHIISQDNLTNLDLFKAVRGLPSFTLLNVYDAPTPGLEADVRCPDILSM